MRVRLSLLGPFQVTVDGEALALGGSKQRAVLAALALQVNRVVPAHQLVDAVWGDDVADRAGSTLQVYVSNLRRVLEPGRGRGDPATRLTTERAGYMLRAEPDELDTTSFRGLAADGKSAFADGDAARAAELYGRALALWRGPALADLATHRFFMAAAADLEEQRLAVLEARIDAQLAAGRHGDVIGELEQLVARHPLRERFHGQRMLALYRCDRQADALAAFQEARQILSEELGLDPSTALRRIESGILAQDPDLDPPAPVTTSPTPPSARGLPVAELPAAIRQSHPFAFTGRASELQRLEDAWKAAAGASRQIVLVAGEPGIGKTRLASVIAARAHDEGATVLFGRCEEDLDVPFKPLVEALGQLVDSCDAALLAAHVGAHGGELARLVPSLARRHPGVPPPSNAEPGTQRYLLFEAITDLLAAAARVRPVVLFIDDLQWADKATLLALRHIARKSEPMALLLLCTYSASGSRPGDSVRELLGDLWREENVDRIRLGGLGDDEVVAMLTEAAGEQLGSQAATLAHTLRRETDGSPFFVGEMLRHLLSTGALKPREGRWAWEPESDVGIPESVREVINRRLRRLPEEVLRTLSVAAVIGHEFRLDPLSHVLGASEEDVLNAVEEAMEAGVVAEEGVRPGYFRFSHRLIRNALYEDIGVTRRARLHRRVGEALEDLPAGGADDRQLAELAYHWFEATQLVDVDKAVGYAQQAGDRALEMLAYEEAARHYERALSVQIPAVEGYEARRSQLLIALGDARRRAGDPTYRAPLREAAQLARKSRDAEGLATVTLTCPRPGGTAPATGTVDDELVQLCREVLAAPIDDSKRALVTGQLAVELYWTPQHEHRLQLGREAVALARRTGDPATIAQTLIAQTIAGWGPTTLGDRLAAAVELRQLAEELQAPELAFQAAHLSMAGLLEAGAATEIQDARQRAGQAAEVLRMPFYAWNVGLTDVAFAVLEGQERAEKLAFEIHELGHRAGSGDEATMALGAQLVGLRWSQGRLGELVEMIAEHAATAPNLAAWQSALALAHMEAGDPTAAATTLADLAAGGFDVPPDSGWMTCIALAAEACVQLHDEEMAAVLYGRLAPYADRMVVLADAALSWGSVSRLLGLLAIELGRWEEASEHLEHAAELHRRFDARPFLVRTLRAQADLLIRRPDGEAEAARALLLQAEALDGGAAP